MWATKPNIYIKVARQLWGQLQGLRGARGGGHRGRKVLNSNFASTIVITASTTTTSARRCRPLLPSSTATSQSTNAPMCIGSRGWDESAPTWHDPNQWQWDLEKYITCVVLCVCIRIYEPYLCLHIWSGRHSHGRYECGRLLTTGACTVSASK